jgi:hypothetical protein
MQPTSPGRSCPLHYRYNAADLASPGLPSLRDLDVLYVVGGLYGVEAALHAVLALFEREAGRKALVFNGDFHWFDTDPSVFARIQNQVLAHTALRGNVETELAQAPGAQGDDAGCGCAYPDWVGDDVVQRSNRILARLRGATTAQQRSQLVQLPMWQRAEVGGLRLGIVHGDAQSLAGWGFSQENLQQPQHRDAARAWCAQAQVDAFASSHTCLPVYQALLRTGPGAGAAQPPFWIFNNGAAGMPNFKHDGAGLITRVAKHPLPKANAQQRRFGVRCGAVLVDAMALVVDAPAVQRQFVAQWPQGSDAHRSYFERIVSGPDYTAAQVIRTEETTPCWP